MRWPTWRDPIHVITGLAVAWLLVIGGLAVWAAWDTLPYGLSRILEMFLPVR